LNDPATKQSNPGTFSKRIQGGRDRWLSKSVYAQQGQGAGGYSFFSLATRSSLLIPLKRPGDGVEGGQADRRRAFNLEKQSLIMTDARRGAL